MRVFYRTLYLSLLLLLCGSQLRATHFYGIDLLYTHLGGNTYRISFVAFGDCSGAQFPSFPDAGPEIQVFNGNAIYQVISLPVEQPREGVEVTPVCPNERNNTTCVNPNGTVPGVKRFIYSREIELSPSANWRFVFRGVMGNNVLAGRSNSLSNVNPVGTIGLEATLNNLDAPNSSPAYTTIATPFYCINKLVNFNPGAVDPDGDSLVYELVPGVDVNAPLSYNSGYSPGLPLAVAAGSFNFNRGTGQLTFIPDAIQRSLVVYRVSEYRNGKLVGTSMREMTFVIMNCNNNPPAGYIDNTIGAKIIDPTSVGTCEGSDLVQFSIDPVDDDAEGITMEVNGLPQGATLTISNNGSAKPTSVFKWNATNVKHGSYTFFITYTDNSCPIVSKQTQAYTIHIVPMFMSAEVSAAICSNLGLLKVVLPGPDSWDVELTQDGRLLGRRTATTYTDTVKAGVYGIRATNAFGCKADTTVEVPFICDVADVPTAFTPNGDGKNDILLVRAGPHIKQISFRVYNRWGKLVFETNDINIGWDGKVNGHDQPMDTFGYVLSVVFATEVVVQKQGNITLIR
jgi:gliding motility-associated-like protein